MQVIRRTIGRQRIRQTIQREPAVRDTIGNSSEYCAEVEWGGFVVGEVIVAEYDVGEFAIAIWNPQLGERRTVRGNFRDGAVGVGDREDFGRRSFTCATELSFGNGRSPRAGRGVAARDQQRSCNSR